MSNKVESWCVIFKKAKKTHHRAGSPSRRIGTFVGKEKTGSLSRSGFGFAVCCRSCALFQAELLLELFYTAATVDEFLLTGEERVAGRADVQSDFILGGQGSEFITASASNLAFLVVGMDTFFHEFHLFLFDFYLWFDAFSHKTAMVIPQSLFMLAHYRKGCKWFFGLFAKSFWAKTLEKTGFRRARRILRLGGPKPFLPRKYGLSRPGPAGSSHPSRVWSLPPETAGSCPGRGRSPWPAGRRPSGAWGPPAG